MKQPISDSASVARALAVKKRALEAHAAEKLRRRLELEAAGAVPAEPSASDTPAGVMKRWLNGHGADVVVDTAGQELFQIAVDQRGLADAIEYIDRRLFDAQATVAREYLAENMRHWHAIQLRRCRALLELRAANIAAEEFRKKLAAISVGSLNLPGERISGIFSHVQTGDFVQRFLEECRDAEIISAEEIAR